MLIQTAFKEPSNTLRWASQGSPCVPNPEPRHVWWWLLPVLICSPSHTAQKRGCCYRQTTGRVLSLNRIFLRPEPLCFKRKLNLHKSSYILSIGSIKCCFSPQGATYGADFPLWSRMLTGAQSAPRLPVSAFSWWGKAFSWAFAYTFTQQAFTEHLLGVTHCQTFGKK